MEEQKNHHFYAVPWFDDIEEYKKYLELIHGDADPNEAYARWMASASLDFIRKKAVPNSTVRKVVVNVEEFFTFCELEQRSVEDETALAEFATKKLLRWMYTKKRRPTSKLNKTIGGCEWFDSREEYEKCAKAAADAGYGHDWEPYAQWKANAEREFRRNRSAGWQRSVKVIINADEFLRYCRTTGQPISSTTRHTFMQEKLAEKYVDKIL